MADDLVPFEYKYGWQRDMFDLILMSKANKIIEELQVFVVLQV